MPADSEKDGADKALAERIVDLLNSALACDPDAVKMLCHRLTPCNRALADHPTVIAWGANEVRDCLWASVENEAELTRKGYAVGLIGILNGLCPEAYRVGASVDADTGKLTGFSVVDVRPKENI